mmetsp:Transcript_12945/g.26536  ORF Transcript_12945/g.26536 Transcript_12945/m.26536 type:complete len:217 (+) Transcript_12945:1-651(+)
MGGMGGFGGGGMNSMFMNMGGPGMGGPAFPGQGRRTSGNKRSYSASSDPSVIPAGTAVTLKGLSAAGKNGLRGRVAGHDESGGRHVVRLDGGETIAVKPSNLQQHPRVTVSGTSASDLNGLSGTVLRYDAVGRRYAVLVDGGRTVSLRPEGMVVKGGTVVTLEGLAKGDDNGKMGTVEGEKDGRYDVRLGGGGWSGLREVTAESDARVLRVFEDYL